jgi:hypothetical protein
MNYEFLPEALETLFDEGIGACVARYPELSQHRGLLLRMRFQEGVLTDAEIDMEAAAMALYHLERDLVERLILQGYNPPRKVPRSLPRWIAPIIDPWTWTTWQLRRMRLRLSTPTPPPSPSTISGSSLRSAGSGGDAPTDNWSNSYGSTTAPSPAPSTHSEPSIDEDDQA